VAADVLRFDTAEEDLLDSAAATCIRVPRTAVARITPIDSLLEVPVMDMDNPFHAAAGISPNPVGIAPCKSRLCFYLDLTRRI